MTNASLLPVDVVNALSQLEAEWKEGDLTRRGYLKRRGQILEAYPHLWENNGSVVFGRGRERVGHMGGATRRLLFVTEEGEKAMVGPVKSLQSDIARAIAAWEHLYGPWVSGGVLRD